jgi:hypothetical protein
MRIILRGYIARLLHEAMLRYWLYDMPRYEEIKFRLQRLRIQGE